LGEIGGQRAIRAIKKMKEEETHPFVLSKMAQFMEKSD
jgi:hypothetical protein